MNICALGYIVIEATDLQAWRHFGTRVLGLMEATDFASEQRLYLKMDEYCYRILIEKGTRDRFVSAGWELPGEKAYAQALAQLRESGFPVEEGNAEQAQQRRVRAFARFVDPTGRVGELFYGLALDYRPLLSPVGVRRFVTGYQGDMGLGHIAMATPDLKASHDFYTNILGFGNTDYMHFNFDSEGRGPGQGLHFLHVNNPRHHSLALYEDSKPHPGDLVHWMIEVEDLDTLGMMMDRCRAHGIRIVTDLGRHTNDRMVSIYVESPAGFAVEYGFGGAQLNWAKYLPTESARTSLWGHRWGEGTS